MAAASEAMTYPDHRTALQLLENWKERHDALDRMFDAIESSMGLDPNGPLFSNVWNLFGAYTAALARELGDTDGTWLSWFQSDNHMGLRAMEAGYDGKIEPIQTVFDLYELIIEGRKREGVA